ncbi:Kinesin motor domain, partial [Dillenia turbinata]
MEATKTNGSPQCPNTVTVRRNPHRRARPTPSAAAPQPSSFSESTLASISSFPVDEILSIDVSENPNSLPTSTEDNSNNSFTESLKVFLRIKPLTTPNDASPKNRRNQNHRSKIKNTWPKAQISKESTKKKVKKRSNSCITINNFKSVTLSPPPVIQDSKRIKSEIYEGFSQVFAPESSQDEVYEKMVRPLVEDFLRGKSGMLAAIGPTGSGKTHTIFGSTREPGMVPQAIRCIFERSKEIDSDPSTRMFYLSMFEIYSERGKGEKLYDLSQEGGDLFMQKSTIKGLKEVVISDVAKAESFIACGMLKRTTAVTNANSQSSRSQCIISIRQAFKMENEVGIQQNDAVLTIVDLAGAERERRTGNQGARLLESNFINNTSMVFGLCLRSLLEYQKNPKKPLEKHFQNSLLTRYLRDYLEGKKRMALILTVKSGEEDYLDTSFLLRQASPYMNIKFNNVEESSNLLSNKRTIQALPRLEQQKRLKVSNCQVLLFYNTPECLLVKERIPKIEAVFSQKVIHVCLFNSLFACLDTSLGHINHVPPRNISVQSENATKVEVDELAPDKSNLVDKDRNDFIMKNFAKALWNVLKQYKKKLEVLIFCLLETESEAHDLREKLKNEMLRCLELERELKYSKTQCTCSKEVSAKPAVDDIIGWVGCSAEARVSSLGMKNLNQQINQV